MNREFVRKAAIVGVIGSVVAFIGGTLVSAFLQVGAPKDCGVTADGDILLRSYTTNLPRTENLGSSPANVRIVDPKTGDSYCLIVPTGERVPLNHALSR